MYCTSVSIFNLYIRLLHLRRDSSFIFLNITYHMGQRTGKCWLFSEWKYMCYKLEIFTRELLRRFKQSHSMDYNFNVIRMAVEGGGGVLHWVIYYKFSYGNLFLFSYGSPWTTAYLPPNFVVNLFSASLEQTPTHTPFFLSRNLLTT